MSTMPPRKRQRVSISSKALDSVVAGNDTPGVPMTMDAVPNLMKTALGIVDLMYSLRHSTEKTIHLSDMGGLSPKDGLYTWPVGFGGTFKQIAQRAWSNPEKLMEMSCDLAVKCGFSDATDNLEFMQQWCKQEAGSLKFANQLSNIP